MLLILYHTVFYFNIPAYTILARVFINKMIILNIKIAQKDGPGC